MGKKKWTVRTPEGDIWAAAQQMVLRSGARRRRELYKTDLG